LFCQKDNEYFNQAETIRGYEFANNQYITLSDNDINKVTLKSSHTIDILKFIGREEIDPLYFYDIHYLEPENTGIKPFFLLQKALEKSRRLGIAKIVFQNREHLCCLRPFRGTLVLHTVHYDSEVIPLKENELPQLHFNQAEINMATSLIEAMSDSFKPELYCDKYEKALREVIESKLNGREIQQAPRIKETSVADLMETLKASLAAAEQQSTQTSRT
jgi:DNA end-binding protein Ku